MDDWIVWQPDSVFSYWTPGNIKHVISQGLETAFTADGTNGNVKWHAALSYTYTSAQNMDTFSDDDLSGKKQLIYVPEHALHQNVRLMFRDFILSYDYNYTGSRYTSSDNSRYLPSFGLHDISISKKLFVKNSAFDLRFSLHNLFDKNYQVIAWQPMPGRNFEISVKYIFNKTQNRYQP